MQLIASQIWVENRDLRFLGVQTGTRMTVVQMQDGGLFVHSPVALDPQICGEIHALGA